MFPFEEEVNTAGFTLLEMKKSRKYFVIMLMNEQKGGMHIFLTRVNGNAISISYL